MIYFFKPEDFDEYDSYLRYNLCRDVNEKLNKLIESWPVVYGKSKQWDQTDGRPDSYVGCTHKARLAFVEEIKKEPCKHCPEFGYGCKDTETRCKHCGVKLVATWGEK